MGGSSPRTLIEKLGIKPGWRAALVHAPEGYAEKLRGILPPGAVQVNALEDRLLFIQGFFRWRVGLERDFPILAAALSKDGMLWVCWPRRSSGLPADLDENRVREIGLAAGLVDVKALGVDVAWSGLKFVFRRVDR